MEPEISSPNHKRPILSQINPVQVLYLNTDPINILLLHTARD